MTSLTNLDNISVITHRVNDTLIEQRQSDGYVNATALAKAYKLTSGKRRDVGHWLEMDRTKETLQHLSSITGIPVIELYQVFRGSSENGGGTWIHPRLAVRFGVWLSDEFGYLVEEWVNQWLTSGLTQDKTLMKKVAELEQKLSTALDVIATLQSQIGNLLPPDNSFAPPGWDAEIWRQLPPQDKRHFRFLALRLRFRPDNQTNLGALPSATVEEMKLQQRYEMEQLVGLVSDEEKARIETAKQEMLARFYAEGGES